MRINKKKKIWIFPLPMLIGLAVVIFGGVGIVGALNGWFGGGASIPSDTMTRGLVGYWSFEEGQGTTTYDGSNNGNNGTLTNGPRWTQGKVGGALQFDAKDDYVNVADSDSLDLSNITIDAWVYRSAYGNGAIIQKKAAVADTNSNYTLWWGADAGVTNNRRVAVDIGNTSSSQRTESASEPSLNVWHHIAFTYDDSSKALKIYIDGILDKSATLTGSPTINTGYLALGCKRGADGTNLLFFNGSIDEVRIYNRALSAGEVKYHYNRGGPVAQWKFDEGSGDTAYDESDNNNDGNLAGTCPGGSNCPAWVAGKYGSALSFDGTDDYVSAGSNSSLDVLSGFSISAWVKTSDNTLANQYLVAKDTGVFGDRAYELYLVSGVPQLYIFSGGISWNRLEISWGSQLVNNTWYHIAVTWDGGTDAANVKMYVNGVSGGVPREEGTFTALSACTDPLMLGALRSSSPISFFNGVLDDIRIYNYARTADEIALDYNAGFAARFGYTGQSCSIDPGSCMDKGLVGYWNMDDGSGTTTADLSGNNNTGVFATAASSPKWTTGIKPLSGGVSGGGALSFDGKDDYVSINDSSSLDLTTSGTIEAWIKINSLSGTLAIVGRNTNGYFLGVYSTGKISWGKNGVDEVQSSATLSTNTWYHIVTTRTGGIDYIYINGALDNSGVKADFSALTDAVRVGLSLSGTLPFNGFIDDVRIYNRALSAEEVRYHYNKGAPVAYWKFDEGSGSTAFDSSNNNNDGTLYGGMATATSQTSGWKSGKYGSALSFDSADDYVDVGTGNTLNITGAFTVAAWAYSNQDSPDAWHRYCIFSRFNGVSSSYELRYETNTKIAVIIADGTNWKAASSSVSADVWNYVVGVYDGTNLKFYLNGELKDTVTSSAPGSTANTSTYIGRRPNDANNHFWNGYIDDVRVYNYARTADEIRLDYNEGAAAKFGPVGEGIASDCDTDPGSCMDKGMVGYWNMDDGAGTTTADLSGNNNVGVFATAASSPKWTSGIKPLSGGVSGGGALSFDGKDDYVGVGTNSFPSGKADLTVECWFKTSSAAAMLLFNYGTWTWYEAFLLTVETNGRVNISILYGASVMSSSGYHDGKWHQAVATVSISGNTANIQLFIDGNLINSGSTTNLSLGLTRGRIGTTVADTPGSYFDGLIDEVRIYNRALSATEVRYHYNRAGPVGYWKFDEGQGSTAFDESNNNNDGTLYGGMATSTAENSGWKSGKYGTALSFDGTDDYVSVPDSANWNFGTGDFTLGAWVKIPDTSGIKSYLHVNDAANYIGLYAAYSTKPLISVNGTLTYATNPLTANVWHHLTVVRSGSTIYWFINGVQDTSGSITYTADNSGWVLGKEMWGNYFNGLIDDVRIYNYARTAEQILQDYNVGLSTHFK